LDNDTFGGEGSAAGPVSGSACETGTGVTGAVGEAVGEGEAVREGDVVATAGALMSETATTGVAAGAASR